MRTRRATAETYYNGKKIQTTTDDYLTSFEYSDPSEGESDSLTLSLADPADQWISAWLPSKGDEISAVIRCTDRDEEGDEQQLECGTFIIDDLSYSAGTSGSAFKISAVSAPTDDAFSATQRTQTWEGVTLRKVADTIAERYKMSLVFDADDVKIATQEQSSATDSAFLANLCKSYGLFVKVFAKKLVIFDREKYKKADTVATVAREEMDSLNWNTTVAGSYTGGSISYTDPDTGKDVSYTTGAGKRLLTVNTKADNLADAKRKLDAAIAAANHDITTISFSCLGRLDFVSGQTITITGFGHLSGKYYVDDKIDSITGSGFKSKVNASLVTPDTESVILDAIARLASIGVIRTPEYWALHWRDVPNLDGLLINMATVIKQNKTTGIYNDATAAINHLTSRGVINSPAYWTAHQNDLPFIPQLLINAANAG